MKNKWYRPVLYYFACGLHRILLLLPRTCVLFLARILARIVFCLVRRERVKTIENLSRAFGSEKTPKQIALLAKRVFENFALTACDFALFPKLTASKIQQLINYDEIGKIKKHIPEGKGFIILTAHMGNFELLGPALIVKGYRGCVIGRRIKYHRYNDLIVKLRLHQGVETFYRDRPMKELVKRLRNGQVVGILPDQDIADLDGVFVDFFGMPAYTPTGPVKIAMLAKVPIVVAFLIRVQGGYRLIVDEILDTEKRPLETKQDAVDRITREWNARFEAQIRAVPEQWAWMHNRWKTQHK